MQLHPGTLGMTVMLAMMAALGPISTDIYLPSMPGMATALGSDLSRVQLTLSVYLFAFALGQTLYGPIADRIGRKPAILGGLALYCVGSGICTFAPSTDTLIAARALQGLGGAAPIVLSRAIVRDIYDGPAAARELSRIGMIMGLVPAAAPLLGGVLDAWLGWRANFAALFLSGLGLAAAIMLLLPETVRERRPEPLSFASVFGSFGVVLRHPVFRANAALNSLAFAGLFSFISGSSFVLQKAYGLSPMGFAVAFSIMCGGFIAGAILTQNVIALWGPGRTIRMGVVCLVIGGLAMVGLMLAGVGPYAGVAAPMALYAFGIGLVLPSANASAMMPFPERAGAASSLGGLLQCTAGAGVAATMAAFLDGRPMVMPFVIAGMGIASALVALLLRPAD
jgi:DHA1 family bicyclomycin/chloramphenicol resistance-like MFS transporter